MQNFLQFLTEDRNTHLEHLEDDILNDGSEGRSECFELLRFSDDYVTEQHS